MSAPAANSKRQCLGPDSILAGGSDNDADLEKQFVTRATLQQKLDELTNNLVADFQARVSQTITDIASEQDARLLSLEQNQTNTSQQLHLHPGLIAKAEERIATLEKKLMVAYSEPFNPLAVDNMDEVPPA